MVWVKLDDQFFSHPKVLRAGRDARDVYLVALTYAGQHLTDGYIPEGALPIIGQTAIGGDCTACAAKLVEIGLWETAAGGYFVHDYLGYQQSRADVEHDREKNAGRQANFRTRRTLRKRNAQSNGVTPSADTESVTPLVRVHRSYHIKKIEREEVDIVGDVVGASPSAADAPLSSLCSSIAKAAHLKASHDSLRHLIAQHPKLDHARLLFETEMAAEWIADPKQNKRKRTMSTRFLHNWFKIAEETRPRAAPSNGTSNGYYASAEAKPLPDGRGIPSNAKPGKLV